MKSPISKFDPSFSLVSDKQRYIATDPFRIWMLQVYENGLLIDSGSPEGSVEAQQGRFYMDESGSPGAILFIKQQADISGDRTQGWVAIG